MVPGYFCFPQTVMDSIMLGSAELFLMLNFAVQMFFHSLYSLQSVLRKFNDCSYE